MRRDPLRYQKVSLAMKQRYWAYVEPDKIGRPLWEILSEEEILTRYYGSWVKKCKATRVPEPHTYDECLRDWVTVNWAVEVEDPDLPIKLYKK